MQSEFSHDSPKLSPSALTLTTSEAGSSFATDFSPLVQWLPSLRGSARRGSARRPSDTWRSADSPSDGWHLGWEMPGRARHPLMHQVWEFFEYPHSSCAATVYSYAMNLTILACVLVSWVDIVYPDSGASVAQGPMETWFVIEVLVRFIASPNRAMFMFNLYNLVDLAVVLQIVVRLVHAVFDTRSGEVYQAVKVFVPPIMLLKLLRRFPSFNLLLSAFYNAVQALPVLLYTLMVVVLAFAGLIYLAEPRTNIPWMGDALWLTCVSMSTVGYGDLVPVSAWGKFWTGCLLVVGALYMAIPIGIVGKAFSNVWEDRDRLYMLCHIRDRVVQTGITPDELFLMFDELDRNKDGLVCLNEFRRMFKLLNIPIGDRMCERIFAKLDADGEGTIDFEEMFVGMFPAHKYLRMFHHVARAPARATSGIAAARMGAADGAVDIGAGPGAIDDGAMDDIHEVDVHVN